MPAHATTIVIRPHPRDSLDKYRDLVGRRTSGLLVRLSAAGDPDLAIASADLVVGMNSSLLHRAHQLGFPTHSLTSHRLGDEHEATP